MLNNEKNSKHVLGLWLAFGGGILCINPYFILFAFPITLVGICLIWFSTMDILSKIVFSLLPFVLPVAFYSLIIISY
jgi:hypothetical protein